MPSKYTARIEAIQVFRAHIFLYSSFFIPFTADGSTKCR